MKKKILSFLVVISIMLQTMPAMAAEIKDETMSIVDEQQSMGDIVVDNDVTIEGQEVILEEKQEDGLSDMELPDEREAVSDDNVGEATGNEKQEAVEKILTNGGIENEINTSETFEEIEDICVEVTEEVIEKTAEIDILAENDEMISSTTGVEINEINFPDANFREYIEKRIDYNGDGVLSVEEQKIDSIEIVSKNISSLKGIEYFTNLQVLKCGKNQLTELELYNNPKLFVLDCNDNQLSKLDVSLNPELGWLNCENNILISLEFGDVTKLIQLVCGNNKLTSLNINNLHELTHLHCNDNQLQRLDTSHNPKLESLVVSNNQLVKLDVHSNLELKTIYANENKINEVDLSQNHKVKSIMLYTNPLLSLKLSEQQGEYNTFILSSVAPLDGYQFDASQLTSFDENRMSGLTYLTYENKKFTINKEYIANTGMYIGYYKYDCGNGKIMQVTFEVAPEAFDEVPAPTPKPTPTSPETKEWPFTDVAYKPGNWKYEAVKFVYENNIMNGIGDGSEFQPDAPLTRAMFATMLYRMAGQPAVTYTAKFPDVPANKWYSNAVIWASEKGIVGGYGNGRFGTNDYITREQIAKMLMEYGKVQGYDVSQSADFGTFADASLVSGWANDYMKWAVGSGMISGSQKNGKYYLNPKGNATRAESATMLKRFMEKY